MPDEEFTRRRLWFNDYMQWVREGVMKAPPSELSYPTGIRETCPCCGYPTLSERGHYEICILCHWEDDRQDDFDADSVWGGPNADYSLAEARHNFSQYGTKRRLAATDKWPTSPEGEQAKQAIIAAFDAMIGETNPDVLNMLWQHEIVNRERYNQLTFPETMDN